MTTIAAIHADNNKIYFGSDDLTITGDLKDSFVITNKVWKYEDILMFGVSGGVAAPQAIEDYFHLTDHEKALFPENSDKFMRMIVIRKIKEIFEENDIKFDGEILIGYSKKGLYTIDSEFSCLKTNYYSIGSGRMIGFGALEYGLNCCDHDQPEDIVRNVIEICAKKDLYSDVPVHINILE